MRRVLTVLGLFLATLLVSPRPARADFWDWLQEFSGPGPFHARLPNLMFDICPGDAQPFNEQGRLLDSGEPSPFLRDFDEPAASTLRSDNGKGIARVPKCIYADFRFFENRPDDNFGVPGVKVDFYQAGVSVRLHHAIGLGFGGGAMRISSPGNPDAWQPMLTAPRVVIKPLLIYGSAEYWRKHNRLHLVFSTVKYYLKEDIILGHVTGQDFGAKPGSANADFDFLNDRVFSTGFVVDISDALTLAFRKAR